MYCSKQEPNRTNTAAGWTDEQLILIFHFHDDGDGNGEDYNDDENENDDNVDDDGNDEQTKQMPSIQWRITQKKKRARVLFNEQMNE